MSRFARPARPRLAPLALALAALLGGPVAAQSLPALVISQVYGGGGNSGATLNKDYVEIFNRGSSAVSLEGWSLQYASSTGTGNFASNSPLALPGAMLQPGQYLLLSLAGGANGAALPTPDKEGAIAAAAANGKFVLVAPDASGTASGLACNGGSAASSPCNAAQLARIADAVGYGNANYFEGGAAAPALSATRAAFRAMGGCTDSNHNGNDFTAALPAPRNSASPLNPCSVTPPPLNQPIAPVCMALSLVQGQAGSAAQTASDPDSVVNAVRVVGSLPSGLSLGTLTPATGEGGTASVTLSASASLAAGSYPVELSWSNDESQTANCTATVTVEAPAAALTPIPSIQGTGARSPLAGQTVSTEGVVTKVLNNGFFLQDPVGDGNPLSSDGVFVFTSSAPTVVAGDRVRVSGSVIEFDVSGSGANPAAEARPLTEIGGSPTVVKLGTAALPAPVAIDLATQGGDLLERVEGMLVTVGGPITVSQNFFLGRFGQMTVAAGDRVETPTNRHRPGPEAQALAESNARRTLLLDDSSSLQNPNPIPYLGEDATVRAGDTTPQLTGVIDFGLYTASTTGLSGYRLQPTVMPVFSRANPRSSQPPVVGGSHRVASFNLLNYFTTFTNGRTADGASGQGCSLGSSVSAGNCRGASNLDEFNRQQAKLVAAIKALDADVLGLIELQNNGMTAVNRLVDALNTELGGPVYAAVADPASGTGTDAIKTALIYKPARLGPVGASLSDTAAVHSRPPVAQTFQTAAGSRFTVVVNHFKSKGCDGASGADLDQGDGQGCFNATRVAQARALLGFINRLQAARSDVPATPELMVLGDLNAYAQEDPIATLRAAGLVDEIGRDKAFGYSFVFDGAAGRLDHALSTPALAARVVKADEWAINADEPSVLDYNTEFKPDDRYSPTPFRASDHDPVLVGLNLAPALVATAARGSVNGTTGDDVIVAGPGANSVQGGPGADVFVIRNLREAGDTVLDFTPGVDRIELAELVASLGLGGHDLLASGHVLLQDNARGLGLLFDADGRAGPARASLLMLLPGVNSSQIQPRRDLGL